MKSIEHNNWNSFFTSASLSSNQDKGLAFELLTVKVLKSHPIYASLIENVWLLREGVPSDLRKKLNIPSSDEGIDIIAQTFAGEYWAIQCKFKSSKEPPNMRELSTFNNLAHTHCKNISMAILFHTGEKGVRKKDLMGEKYAEVGLEFWLSLNSEHWKNINSISKTKKVKPTLRKPRDHQKQAIKNSQSHFLKENASRGRLIMPCGTGKSLTAFWIANGLKAQTVIVAVPSLNLIKQSLEDWTAEFIAQNENPRPEWQVICSDDSTSKLEDDFVSDVYSLGIPTTTSVEEIASFLKRKTYSRKIIFTTYQSSDKLAKAARSANFSFDLAILDEAHKTVGIKSKSFATLLSDENITIKKRMFMTATERVLKGTNDDVLSMDDESVYGKRFYQLTFKDAIHSSPQIISDYKILTIAVTNSQIQEMIQKNKLLTDKKNSIEEQDAQSLAAAIALRQATAKYGIKHAISFHRSIKAAESFTNLNLKLNSSKVDNIDLTSYHISSKKSAGQRSQLLDDFKADELALMTNARCLTEGVNVPTIDCVLFADPKQSIVDIVQAAGRALRVSPGKKYGYIMMPLIVPDDMELEEFTETTPFKQISRIVAALSTQDERIVEEFRLNDQGKRTSERRVEISGSIPVGLKLDISTFASSIEAKYWEKVGRANWRSFNEAKKFVQLLKLNSTASWKNYLKSGNKPKDIPTNPQNVYFKPIWQGWGDWLGTDRLATFEREYKPFDSARKFAQSLNLKSGREWKVLGKSGNLPLDIPSDPRKVYKNQGWISFGDWLGTNTIAPQLMKYRDFKKARTFANSLQLKNNKEWRLYCISGKKPVDIPSNPQLIYNNKGWISYGDWLGNGNIGATVIEFREFTLARELARSLNLKNRTEWRFYIQSGKKPFDIPNAPDQAYKNKGWKGYGDWLGTGVLATFKREYKNYSDCRRFAIKNRIISITEWKYFVRSNKKINDIPTAPDIVYKNKGWNGWPEFLGKK
jgi:superfamily II DNA or RNA helicase